MSKKKEQGVMTPKVDKSRGREENEQRLKGVRKGRKAEGGRGSEKDRNETCTKRKTGCLKLPDINAQAL